MLKRHLKSILQKLDGITGFAESHDILLHESINSRREAHSNPILKRGYSFFSQADEDGIIEEILFRIRSKPLQHSGVFAEMGVGDGLQNNTLNLLMHGWSGMWFGGEKIAFDVTDIESLYFKRGWITLDSIDEIFKELSREKVDVFSLDLDGNDLHFAKRLLELGFKPRVWVQEYNANFPPNSKWSIKYNPNHVWDRSTYWGASLGELNNLFVSYGYELVVCNITGINAFFVLTEDLNNFTDVPKGIEKNFMPYRPWFPKSRQTHLGKILSGLNREHKK